MPFKAGPPFWKYLAQTTFHAQHSPLVSDRSNGSRQRVRLCEHFYLFLPEATVGCHAEAFWLGAAAITLIFSFLGFLGSRLLLCCPLAMSISSGFMTTQITHTLTSYLRADQTHRIAAPGVAACISGRGKRGDDQRYACLPGIASLKMARRRTKTGPVQNVTTNSSRRALLCLESVPCRIVAGVHPSSGFSL